MENTSSSIRYRLNVALEWHNDGDDETAWQVIADLLNELDR